MNPLLLFAAASAGGLFLAGIAGTIFAVGGVNVDWRVVLSLGTTGAGLGLCLALVYDLTDQRHERRSYVREREAGAWLKEVQAERLAAELDAARAKPAEVPNLDEQERAWRESLERFFRAGDNAGGFSIRKLEGVVGSTTWGILTDFYCSQQGSRVLRVAPGDEGTTWGHGWGLDAAVQALAAGKLPHPAGPPPVVEVIGYNAATRRDTKRQRKTAPEVVEGTATTLS